MRKLFIGAFFVVGIIAFFACDDGIDYEKIRREELAILKEYINQNHSDAEPTSSGLYYIELKEGVVEDTIKPGDRVQVYYATWVLDKDSDGSLDSSLVDQSIGYLEGHRYEPLSFRVGEGTVVAGLEEGITYMNPQTKGKLVINSELAYGQRGSSGGGVGMFKTLIMEIEVYKVFPLEVSSE